MPVGSISGFDATVRTMQQLDRLAPRGAVVREWWTRPSRREAAKLRRTREVRKAEEVAP
jgi:hypothetical protein